MFSSNATEFHVTLWNLNYGTDAVKEPTEFTKEFTKAQRRIYSEKIVSKQSSVME